MMRPPPPPTLFPYTTLFRSGLAGSAVFLLGVVAVGFYRSSRLMWPLAALTIYVVLLLGIYQLLLWTLAIAERSEEHTSELQSQFHLVCRLLLEKKKNNNNIT